MLRALISTPDFAAIREILRDDPTSLNAVLEQIRHTSVPLYNVLASFIVDDCGESWDIPESSDWIVRRIRIRWFRVRRWYVRGRIRWHNPPNPLIRRSNKKINGIRFPQNRSSTSLPSLRQKLITCCKSTIRSTCKRRHGCRTSRTRRSRRKSGRRWR